MKNVCLCVILLSSILFGCGAQQTGSSGAQASASGTANAFNPYMQSTLPNTRKLSSEGKQMLVELGAKAQTIEGEARHRKNWREEIYPVVFGDRKAPHEIIVVLDFVTPASASVWRAVVDASKSLQPQQCKIVVFGKSQENYGTDLMGMAIWLAHSRPGQAMPWLTYALNRWNEVKAAQKKAGKVKTFTNEFDATASASDYPIPFGFLNRLQPPVPARQEVALAKYCYDAGNVNMYQATQICQYYDVTKLPAVIVDGRHLGDVSENAILAALR